MGLTKLEPLEPKPFTEEPGLSGPGRTLAAMTRSKTVRRLLVVEARDLDTDARFRRELEIDAPTDESGQRAQLATVVARLHPDAQMRSFGGEAASFLDREHLVVAHYAAAVADDRTPGVASRGGDGQQPLFAA